MSGMVAMTDRMCATSLDFHSARRDDIPLVHTFTVRILTDGQIDGAVAFWEIWSDEGRSHRLSTRQESWVSEPWGFSREVHWGPMFQYVEDFDSAQSADQFSVPNPFEVSAGE